MDNKTYHADTTRISKSGLDKIAQSPAHYYYHYLSPERPEHVETDAMFMGSLVHKLILEPSEFGKTYMLLPAGAPAYPQARSINAKIQSEDTARALKFYADLQSAYPGVQIVDSDLWDNAHRIRDAVMAHGFARELLSDGEAERTVLFDDPDTGAKCKCRPDWMRPDNIVVDLKTTGDASSRSFGSSSFNYRYHVQAPFYLDGINHEFGYERVKHFVFIAVEKTPPYGVGVYFADNDTIELGRQEYRRNLSTYASCIESGKWPAYSDEPTALQLPAWAFKK